MAKDRKITTFDFGDILHYQKNNCFFLAEMSRVMNEISLVEIE